MSEPAAAPVIDESLYQQALEELRSPRPMMRVTSLLFTVLMLVFVAGLFIDLKSVTGVVVFVAAIAVHEAGHALGMRLFGFRDIQMFFIPFFGAAVSGRERGAPAWKEAVVSLLGPLPGLLAGIALLILASRQPLPAALPFQVAGALIWLNAFNLLPLGFLDGGRFLERVLFSRHRVLEVAFLLVGSLLLALLALAGRMYVLGLVVVLSLMGLPARWRILTASAKLREALPSPDPDPEWLDEPGNRAVFLAAQAALRYPANQRPADVALTMESILKATKRPPGALANLGLLLVFAFGLFSAAVGVIWLSIPLGPVAWRTVQKPGWRAEFPRAPLEARASMGAERPAAGLVACDCGRHRALHRRGLARRGRRPVDERGRRGAGEGRAAEALRHPARRPRRPPGARVRILRPEPGHAGPHGRRGLAAVPGDGLGAPLGREPAAVPRVLRPGRFDGAALRPAGTAP